MYEWWDQLGVAAGWKNVKGRHAPRDVQQVRRLNKAMNDNTMHKVSDGGWRMVRQHTQEEMTEQQAFRRLQISDKRLGAIYAKPLGGAGTFGGNVTI